MTMRKLSFCLVTLCIGSYSPRPSKKRTRSSSSVSDQQPPSIPRIPSPPPKFPTPLHPKKLINNTGKRFGRRAAPVSGIVVPPAPLDGDECEQGAIPSALLT